MKYRKTCAGAAFSMVRFVNRIHILRVPPLAGNAVN
jgi:hypothetical protein